MMPEKRSNNLHDSLHSDSDSPPDSDPERYLIGVLLRLGAGLLDVLHIGFLVTMILGAMSLLAGRPLDRMDTELCALLSLFVVGVYLISSWAHNGQTPGSWMVSQQLLSTRTGQPPTVLRSLLRLLVMPLSILPLGLGFIWASWSVRKQTWHDLIAGTVVVSDASYRPREEDRVWSPDLSIDEVTAGIPDHVTHLEAIDR